MYVDTKERNHNPSFNLFTQTNRHLAEGDLLPGDIFVTHPGWGPLVNDVVSTLVILDVSPVKFELDLASSHALKVWRDVKELCFA